MCVENDNVIGTHGERILCSASSPKEDVRVFPAITDVFKILKNKTLFKKRYKCGHSLRGNYIVSVFGQEIKLTKQLCPDCLVEYCQEHAIHCCLCGNAIMPGDPVALYGEGSGVRENIATRIEGGGFVGCMRWDCCVGGGFFSGHWSDNGFQSYWKDEDNEDGNNKN